jgi:hypothetical protein
MEEYFETTKATLRNYGGTMGINTNKKEKLYALEEGICIASSKGYANIITKGDF